MVRSLASLARHAISESLLLPIGAAIALVWANVSLTSYDRFANSIHFAVNDIGMVFFFALAAKEIWEATLPGGAFANPKQAAVPLLAAMGGMLFPALIYTGIIHGAGRPELARGWAIPCATDIAFSYLAARYVFPKKHQAIPFLLLLAIADDAFGLMILAIFYPTREISPAFALVGLPLACAMAWALRRARVHSFWAYLGGPGLISWWGLFAGGFHPALALVPIIPFLPHGRRDIGVFDEREEQRRDTLDEFEHWWNAPVQYVLFFFGLANAGVPVGSVGLGTSAVVAALIVGKPIGILLLTYAPALVGLRPPAGLRVADVAVLGIAAGIGFTVSLFFATAAFTDPFLLAETKMGALLSFFAAPLAIGVGRLIGLSPGTAIQKQTRSQHGR